MKSRQCSKCGKVIEGFSDKHVDWLMFQHNLKHRNEERDKEVDEQHGN